MECDVKNGHRESKQWPFMFLITYNLSTAANKVKNCIKLLQLVRIVKTNENLLAPHVFLFVKFIKHFSLQPHLFYCY